MLHRFRLTTKRTYLKYIGSGRPKIREALRLIEMQVTEKGGNYIPRRLHQVFAITLWALESLHL
jgi:hypothetical protein